MKTRSLYRLSALLSLCALAIVLPACGAKPATLQAPAAASAMADAGALAAVVAVGHWQGEPEVAFDMTADGKIANFRMTAPFGTLPDQTCTVEIEQIPVDAQGWFAIGGDPDSAVSIDARFTDPTSVSGTYKITACSDGNMATVVMNAAVKEWRADWASEAASDPIPVTQEQNAATPEASPPAPANSVSVLPPSAPTPTLPPTAPALAPAASGPPSYFEQNLAAVQLVVQTELDTNVGSDVAWSPDSKTIAVASLGLMFFLPGVERAAQTLNSQNWIWAVAYSPDGSMLAWASYDNGVTVRDLASGDDLRTWDSLTQAHQLVFSWDGTLLAVASPSEQNVRVFEVSTGRELQTLTSDCCAPGAIAFSPDGQTLAWGAESIRLWDVKTGREISNLNEHQGAVNTVAFSPDGRLLASGAGDHAVNVYDAATGQLLHTLAGHEGPVSRVAFSPDGRLLASASSDTTIRIWDPYAGKELRSLAGHTGDIQALAFSPDGTMLASGGQDAALRIWAPPGSAASIPVAAPSPTPLPDRVQGKTVAALESQSAKQVAWSPDGSVMAVATYGLHLYEAGTWQELPVIGGGKWVSAVAFSPDSQIIAAAFQGNENVSLWTLDGREVHTFAGTSNATHLVFAPDGEHLGICIGQVVQVVDVASGDLVLSLNVTAQLTNAVFSSDGRWLATVGPDLHDVQIWDAASGEPVRTLSGHTGTISALAFSPDGATLASASDDRTIRLWDCASWSYRHTLSGHTGYITGLAFSPDSRWLASSSGDLTVRIWDVAGGSGLGVLTGHTEGVTSIDFSPDGRWLVSGAGDKAVRVWEVGTSQAEPAPIPRPAGPIATPIPLSPSAISPANAEQVKQRSLLDQIDARDMVWSPNGSLVAVAGYGLSLLDGETLAEIHAIETSSWVSAVAFSPDSSLVTAVVGESIRLWDVQTGAEVRTLTGVGEARSLAFSPDGSILAVATGQAVKLLDVVSGQELRLLLGHIGGVMAVVFRPDGEILAGGGNGIELWDVSSGQELRTLEGYAGQPRGVTFSPDGQIVAAGTEDDAIQLWDVASGRKLQNLAGHGGQVMQVAFSPDGRMLVSAAYEPDILLWDVTTGATLRRLAGHSQAVVSVSFAPDGSRVASASMDGTVRLWSIVP